MRRNAIRRFLAAGFAAVALLCPALLRGASEGRQLVVVIDRAGTSPKMLAEAEEESAGVFRRAGIELIWEEERPTSTTSVRDFDSRFPAERPLLIQLVPREGANNTPARLGYATVNREGGGSAEIFCGRVADLMYDFNQPATMTQILGYAMAHEIGHLLSIVGHSPAGIMDDRWDYSDYRRMARRELSFTAAESATMRAALQRRERDCGHLVRAVSAELPDPSRPGDSENHPLHTSIEPRRRMLK